MIEAAVQRRLDHLLAAAVRLGDRLLPGRTVTRAVTPEPVPADRRVRIASRPVRAVDAPTVPQRVIG